MVVHVLVFLNSVSLSLMLLWWSTQHGVAGVSQQPSPNHHIAIEVYSHHELCVGRRKEEEEEEEEAVSLKHTHTEMA